MKKLGTHKDLNVWGHSMDFVVGIYKATAGFPVYEKYGLTNQIRKAATSIPSNIAEGFARRNTRELIQFLYISLGSASELETQLEISRRLGYLADCHLEKDLTVIVKMLICLIRSLKKRAAST